MKLRNPLIFSVMILGVILMGLFFTRSHSKVNLISVQETNEKARSDTNFTLLDVRTPEEYAAGHLANAILIPVQELPQRMEELAPFKGKAIIAYCRTGNRSGRAAELLGASGFTVFNMEGGILKWKESNLPVIEETK